VVRGASFIKGRLRGAPACLIAGAVAVLGLAGCGAGSHPAAAAGANTTTPTSATTTTATVTTTTTATVTTTTTATVALPGTGKPPVTIGDENTPEQFLLGELYYQALKAQGFSVTLDQNIGPTNVVQHALATGQLAMYPEYLDDWMTNVAGSKLRFKALDAEYLAGQHYALKHGLALLNPTPFSNTNAIAVTAAYAAQNGLDTVADLIKVAPELTLGAPPQFQQSADGLPAVQQAYGVLPNGFKALEIGAQYQALAQGQVQAAVVNTTDPQLLSPSYKLLGDPKNVFGWGNVIPVASVRALDAEGPVFSATVNAVSALLTLSAMRELNSSVVVSGDDPATVAQEFLQAQGLIPTAATSS
jgi:osmoprotectant transport system substrate-binding protein